MKVLIISNMYPDRDKNFTYAGIFVKEQLDELNKREGISCDIFAIDGFKSKLEYLKSVFEINKLLATKKYDIIHVHYGLSGLFMLANPFKCWKNVVLTLHGGDILIKQGKTMQVALTKKLLRKVGKVITLNEEMNNVVKKFRDDYKVLPCGVDESFFNSEIKERKNQVLFPGRKDRPVKNYPFFKAVIEAYNKKFGHLEPVIVDGFTRDEVRDLMKSSSAILMTSISEGSPQAIKESMACNLAVVSSDVGDVAHVLGNTTGTYVYSNTESPEDVAERLNHAIEESQTSPNSRCERIRDLQLGNAQVVDNLVEIYSEICSNAK
ncbi:glycosyltransferase [Vibrio sp. TRT 21S02]|uniref:glycosyltransferase n=1 Tax=Vibrio sp. TRT 21S02 TaxID=3418507 RepID=UPI003CEDB86E